MVLKILEVIDVLHAIEEFSKFGWTVFLKTKNSQTITSFFEIFLKSSQRKPNLIETDDGKNFVNKIFTNLLNDNNIESYFRNTSLGTVFAKCFIRTTRDLPINPVFEKGVSEWMDILPTKIKLNNKQ